MITIRSEREIALLRQAGNVVYKTHQYIKPFIKEGITTNELNRLAEEFIIKNDCTPSFKGYEGFPTALCISINDEVVHGFPSERTLKSGDIVTLDIGACYKGYHGDSGWTYKVGDIEPELEDLMKYTEESLFVGLAEVKPGNRVGDIGFAIAKFAKEHKLGVVKELCGHGVGTDVHESPDVPNFGKQGTGPLLREGMVIAVEPMLTLGSPSIYVDDNDWTIITQDHSPSAHYEHTVVVTKDGYEILTGE
jgi:methionyl aminopeptidase